MVCFNDPTNTLACEYIQGVLSQIGLNVSVETHTAQDAHTADGEQPDSRAAIVRRMRAATRLSRIRQDCASRLSSAIFAVQ